MDQSFTKEVEDEANSYFQRIYNHPPNPTISIDEVLEMLRKFKDSPVKKERVGTKFPYHLTAAGLAQLVGRLTAEWEVAGRFPGLDQYSGS